MTEKQNTDAGRKLYETQHGNPHTKEANPASKENPPIGSVSAGRKLYETKK